jgi:hypothetical protein
MTDVDLMKALRDSDTRLLKVIWAAHAFGFLVSRTYPTNRAFLFAALVGRWFNCAMIEETSQANSTVAEKLRSEIFEIEHAIDFGAYRPGPWAWLLTRARATSGADRLAISADVTRVSRKLHLRGGRRTISARTVVTIEAAAIGLGHFLLTLGFYIDSGGWLQQNQILR